MDRHSTLTVAIRPLFSTIHPFSMARARNARQSESVPPSGGDRKEKTVNCPYKPDNDPRPSPEERSARKQVNRLRGFYHHLVVYAVVNAGLAGINLLASPGRLWFHWPLLGWGIWLALHALRAFAGRRCLGTEWEERKLREFLADKG